LPPRRYIPGACSRAGSIHALAHFLKIFLYKKNVHQSKKKYRRQDNELEERDFQELLEEAKQRLKECHDNALAHYRRK
jgi:sulfur relay (sulfurtransferase) complex TusBCD TusD component (DsrE family)